MPLTLEEERELAELEELERLEQEFATKPDDIFLGPKKLLQAPVSAIESGVAEGVKTGSLQSGLKKFGEQFSNVMSAKTNAELQSAVANELDLSQELEAKGVSPYVAKPAEFATEMIADPASLLTMGITKAAANPLSRLLERKAAEKASQVVAREIPASKIANEGYKVSELGKRIQEEGLISNLGRLDKVRARIAGGQSLSKTDVGDIAKIKEMQHKEGLIGKYADDLQNLVGTFTKKDSSVSSKQLMADILDTKVSGAMDPFNPSEPMSAKAIDKIKQILPTILKKDQYTLSELQSLLRGINKAVKPKEFYKDASDEMNAMNESLILARDTVKKAIRQGLQGKEINVAGKKILASDYYDTLNNAQHQLMQLSDVLPKSADYLAERGGLSDVLLPTGMGAGVGYMIGQALDSPLVGAGVGAAWAGGRATQKYMSEKAPVIMSKMYQLGADVMKSPWKYPMVVSGQKATRDAYDFISENNGRKPQSIEDVALMKLPRNTEEAIQSPELLIEKVKQLDPMSLPLVMNAINEDPEKLPDVMFSLSQQFPHAFDSDKYGRFDGKIPAATMMNYIRDLKDDKSISNTERAKHLNSALTKKQSHYTPQ